MTGHGRPTGNGRPQSRPPTTQSTYHFLSLELDIVVLRVTCPWVHSRAPLHHSRLSLLFSVCLQTLDARHIRPRDNSVGEKDRLEPGIISEMAAVRVLLLTVRVVDHSTGETFDNVPQHKRKLGELQFLFLLHRWSHHHFHDVDPTETERLLLGLILSLSIRGFRGVHPHTGRILSTPSAISGLPEALAWRSSYHCSVL